MPLHVHRAVLEPSDAYPYYIVGKRYTSTSTASTNEDSDAITLIVTHATGMHKESWEPVLERVFESSTRKIKEAWAVESPNHGETAVLNEKLLPEKWSEVFEWEDYGRAVGQFLMAGPKRGAGVDFTKRKLVALGHSMGAVSMLWLQESLEFPEIKFSQLIITEPMLQPPGTDLRKTTSYFFPMTYQRRDVWPSRELALKDFSTSKGYKSWDLAVIELFVKHALRDHPASKYAFGKYNGVMLACSRFHEAACYRGGSNLSVEMVDALGRISHEVPVSLVFGEIEDSVPIKTKKDLADPSVTKSNFASVRWVKNAGHLVIQNSPSGVAEAVIDALSHSGRSTFSKL